MTKRTSDFVVIGGGLCGSAIAWGLSRLGAKVCLLDEGDVAYRASRGNFGLVWIQGKGDRYPEYARLTQRAGQLWRSLADTLLEEVGIDVALKQRGGLAFCLSEKEFEDKKAANARIAAATTDIGARMLDAAELSSLVPHLGPDVIGGSFTPRDGDVNPLFLLRAFHKGLIENGGTVLTGQRVISFEPTTQGTVISTETGERIGCQSIVIAAGLGSRKLAALLDMNMPVSPSKGHILVTERLAPFLDITTNSIRQTNEGSVQLGHSYDGSEFSEETRVDVMQTIAVRSTRIFPILARARIVRAWAALRVVSPDGLPIYCRSRAYPGVFGITCHSGITLASIHALQLPSAILAGELPEFGKYFSSERFNSTAVA